jgi:hypothetical protein
MNEQQQNVNRLIERIERHQEALRLGDDAFARRYKQFLGSSKTWTDRLKARKWADFGNRLDKWESKLTKMVAEIDGGVDLDVFFEKMPIWAYSHSTYQLLAGARNDRRNAFLIGPTGVGKTFSMQKLAKVYATRTAFLRLRRGANESMSRVGMALARALSTPVHANGYTTIDGVIAHLQGNPVTLLIDDMHEGGVLAMKVVKSILDETKARVICGVYPTAWHQLVNGSTEAMSEAQQLLGRTIKPVRKDWIKGATDADIEVFIREASGVGASGLKGCVNAIGSLVRRNGNLRLLADAIELAELNADEAGEDLSVDYVQAAVEHLCPPSRQHDELVREDVP